MKNLLLLMCLLLTSCFIFSCGSDSEEEFPKTEQTSEDDENDNEKENDDNKKGEDNDTTKTEINENKSDSTSEDYTIPEGWPSEESMMGEFYYPTGTKWQEVWSATQGTDSEPYGYFYIDFEVKNDSSVYGDATVYKFVKVTDHFIEPKERKNPDFILNDLPWGEGGFFIHEESGIVYQETYGERNGKPLAYNFVWNIGLELYRDLSATCDESLREAMGTVSAKSVQIVTLLDGNKYLYVPSSKLYRGIGKVDSTLFPYIGPLCPSMFETHAHPVGVSRFWRNGKLIYEDTDLASLVE